MKPATYVTGSDSPIDFPTPVNPIPSPITSWRIAASVATCWLFRWRTTNSLTTAAAIAHASCDWCEFPLDLLNDWLLDWNAEHSPERPR